MPKSRQIHNSKIHDISLTINNKKVDGGKKMEQTTTQWETVEPGVWKPQKEEDQIEGVLVHKEPEDKAKGISARYKVENSQGMWLVWGCATLDDRMQHIEVGNKVRITFKGKKDIGKGKMLNVYKVERESTA